MTRASGGDYTIELIASASPGGALSSVRINHRGRLVWIQDGALHDSGSERVFGGGLIADPHINDSGHIAWQQVDRAGDTPGGWEIYVDGERLTHDSAFDGEPRITAHGEVVWVSARGVRSNRRQLDHLARDASSLEVNAHGEIVVRTGAGDGSRIVSSTRGVLGAGDHPDINDCGEVVWMLLAVEDGNHPLMSSTRGVLGSGAFPAVSSAGTVVFTRSEQGRTVLYALRDDRPVPIGHDRFESVDPFPDINDHGEIAFIASAGGRTGVYVARPAIPETPRCREPVARSADEATRVTR